MKMDTGILRRIALAVSLACVVLPSAHARTVKEKKQAAKLQFEAAERLRDSLLGTPESERDRRDYQKVMDAYRKCYYTAPSWAKADSAVLAVAELLDDQGRVFNDPKSYKDAIGQLAFLRREYPGSAHRVEALFTIGQIYRDDLNDREQAQATFQDFLKHYPHSALAPKAKQALDEIGNAEVGGDPFAKKGKHKHPAHHAGEEREAKVAWADAHPAKPAADSTDNKDKGTRADKSNARRTEAKATKTSAQNRAVLNEDAPAPDEAAAEAPAQGQAKATSEDVSAPAPRPDQQSQPGNRLPRLTSIRHWSTPDYVRVAIDLEQEVKYESGRVPHPDRIFFDLYGVKLAPDLVGKSFDVEAGFLHRIRVAQFKAGMARVVLDVDDVAEYSAFLLPNPYRLIIDIHGKLPPQQLASNKGKKSAVPDVVAETKPPVQDPKLSEAKATEVTSIDGKSNEAKSRSAGSNGAKLTETKDQPDVTVTHIQPGASSGDSGAALRRAGEAKGGPGSKAANKSSAGTTELAKADPPRVISDRAENDNATSAEKTPDTNSDTSSDTNPDANDVAPDTTKATTTKPTSGATYQAVAPRQSSRNKKSSVVSKDRNTGGKVASTSHVAAPTANGERSLIRALGLKIGKIVVDAGHGGHDTGTIGPNGLEEKDLVLDVALKLGKLLQNKLGADVVYTRDDDTFIPLETRTAIANKEQADLFISIHANSSGDQSARGIETYYLNFTSSADALEVAARENAVSAESIHELQDLVKKIALKEKIEESREFAADVQKSLYSGLNARNPGLRNRGVKKAPFIVLIGANMPSILAEISFVSNPHDEQKLKTNLYRQQIAESLYKGVAKYINGLSGIRVAAQAETPDNSSSAVAAAK